mgnify:CR=1 FL=1|jgi:protein TonB
MTFISLHYVFRPVVKALLLHLLGVVAVIWLSLTVRQQAWSSTPHTESAASLILLAHDDLSTVFSIDPPTASTEVEISSLVDTQPEIKAPQPLDTRAATTVTRQASARAVVQDLRSRDETQRAVAVSGVHVSHTDEDAKPEHALNAPPDYPITLRQRGIEGTVWLRVRVDHVGLPEQIVLFKTSGYRLFDEAALRAVSRWRFKPAKSQGRQLTTWVEFPVRFILRG